MLCFILSTGYVSDLSLNDWADLAVAFTQKMPCEIEYLPVRVSLIETRHTVQIQPEL